MAFRRHLESCTWCKQHPFNLCHIGHAIWMEEELERQRSHDLRQFETEVINK